MMKTVNELLTLSIAFLTQKGIQKARREAEELLSLALDLPRMELYLQFDRPVEAKEVDRLREYLKKRSQNMPWQYIKGKVQFLGLELKVSVDVLIPRQETELLAEKVIEQINDLPLTVWDVCTGSGCLGLSIKHHKPFCSVILSDISLEAIAVAKENSLQNQIAVDIWHGDLFEAFKELKADIIVCNPPYIAEQDYLALEPEVARWEPKLALVSGKNGYEFYQKLAKEAPCHLYKNGCLYLEIGTNMGDKVKEIFFANGWQNIEVSQDYAGHDRFVKVSGHEANI